ncbi:MAG: helix-turn-helix transcriptional regulator [Candidatus Thiodiazotropha sp. (ex Lucina aurantia)]|uniref:Helix-turn-helix transcriptional regulator n=1 Tax=Candidatus Thiodiazotropha taylori TaxID=2792791 RepID=A0A9E4TSK7_9GAMM|nr:helix-turn-helix transcriptional regulator [Candidatus Thiodiazotropha sp. (ex Lucina pensylvanica)]MBT3016161.1 helix-turn-helix transcriptional regulator [Candidatus Thiodiazotropha taylori]MBT3050530.1 helix-turn-helix transcriptional regulator [Candidatus Thiodiazotropha sp. (ex Codakia orbicularis)]MBV2102156.1 helix-turn-helix transcriptional regulator [Candidatus Thiodiazotropha sp. (ex Lucina aurantia)]MCG7862555.1 helix-turn-helix transcriptional regulator [Candidatus Thiodiazotroph
MVAKIEHKLRSECPIACALDVIGDHWSLLVIRNLMFLGIHEYKDMLKMEEQISSSILTNRLMRLQRDGLIASLPHPESRRRKLYYLTAKGIDLIYMMTELVVWSNKHMGDWVNIPKHKKELIEQDPDRLIQITLEELDAWERQFIPEKSG